MEIGECRDCCFFKKTRECPSGLYEGACHRYPDPRSHMECYWCGEFVRRCGEGVSSCDACEDGQAAETVHIAKVNGILRNADLERLRELIEGQLGGRVVVIDDRFEYVAQLEPTDASDLVQLMYDFLNGKAVECE